MSPNTKSRRRRLFSDPTRRMHLADHYQRLNVPRGASFEQIKAAYRTQVKMYHPDRGGSPDLFQLVAEAYKVLSFPSSRAAYDQALTQREMIIFGGIWRGKK